MEQLPPEEPPTAYMTRERPGMPIDEASPKTRRFTLLPSETQHIGYDQDAYVGRQNEEDALSRVWKTLLRQGD